jgi:penicillin G amidase
MRSLPLLGIVVLAALSCGDDSSSSSSPLPRRYESVPETGTKEITGLSGPVDVVRDTYGMVHIHAKTLEDALRVEGYQCARDRTVQLELIRRSATGRMAELLGDDAPGLIDSDIAMRTVGLARVAKVMVEKLSPEEKKLVDAYADGISQFNARISVGDEEMPGGMIGFPQSGFQPWTAVDVLAVGRFQALNLSYDGEGEIAMSDFVEAARAKMLDKRAGFLVDAVKFAPVDLAKPLDGFPNDAQKTLSLKTPKTTSARGPVIPHRVNRDALIAARAFSNAMSAARRVIGDHQMGMTGSNNWMVGPSKSATGHAMIASDPHLTLSAPAVFWMVQVSVDQDDVDFAGLSFPGLPGIILGFNRHIAWGATTADYDVTDSYEETLTPDGSGVVFKGQNVAIEKVRETINIAKGSPLEYDVLVVPHHGPIAPDITADHKVNPPPAGGKAISVKWIGHEPTNELAAIFGLLRAKNVDDARVAMRSFEVGAQNWVFADDSGNTFYTTQSRIPRRDRAAFQWDPATFTGNIPCMVLPGDGSAEWTGAFLDEAYVPHQKNPPKGWLATANTEQVGTTDDNDPTNDTLPNGEPMYMACWHDIGFRLARIQQRIGDKDKLSLDDLASIQGDARSAMGAKLAPLVVAAIDRALTGNTAITTTDRWKNAKVDEIKELLTQWGAEADYDAASGMSQENNQPVSDAKELMASRATSVLNAWVIRMYHATFDDELSAIGAGLPVDGRRMLMNVLLADPKTLKTYDETLGDSILFDDLGTADVVETRDDRILVSLLDALDFLSTRLGTDRNGWQWGRLHTLRFNALISLWSTLSIPPTNDTVFPNGFPRHGDGYNVDVAGYGLPAALDAKASFSYSHGPTQRFVIDMDPAGPVAKNVLPGGNIWDSRSTHFRDEADRWRKNENRPVPFATADVIASAEERIVYTSP